MSSETGILSSAARRGKPQLVRSVDNPVEPNTEKKEFPMSKNVPGFTLIELLVVISIITLLIAMLLPALAKAQGVAREIVCASNQRELAQAIIEYAQTNGGSGPVWGNTLYGTYFGGAYCGNPYWDQLLYPYIYSSPKALPANATTSVPGAGNLTFAEELAQGIDVPTSTVFLCPTVAVHNWLSDAGYPQTRRYCSYRINGWLAGGVIIKGAIPADDVFNNGAIQTPVKLSNVENPGDVILIFESPVGVSLADPISPSYACARGWFDVYPVHNVESGPSYVNPWGYNTLTGSSNFSFADGHVAAYTFSVNKYSPYLLADSPLPSDITLDPNRSQE